jgi:hypothetical protein
LRFPVPFGTIGREPDALPDFGSGTREPGPRGAVDRLPDIAGRASATGRILGRLVFWAALAVVQSAWAQSAIAQDIDGIRARAQAGDTGAQALYGGALMEGRGVPKNEAEGVEWVKRSASKGDVKGLYLLGHVYLEGRGAPKNPAEGYRLLLQSAEKGFSPAQARVAQLLLQGQVVARDDAAAVSWARRSADQSDPEGQMMLASAYLQGRGVPQDVDKAEELLRKAAEKGHPGAKRTLAELARFRAAQKPAEVEAQMVTFVRENAAKGSASAQYQLSQMYAKGEGVPKDDALAFEWLRKAADQGQPEALTSLALRYAAGKGVERDFSHARALYLKGAQRGNTGAQASIGLYLVRGMGGGKDPVEGLKWLIVAERGGNPHVVPFRQEAQASMSAGDIAEATRRADQFMARPARDRVSK